MNSQIRIALTRKRIIAMIVVLCLLALSISTIARPNQMLIKWYQSPITEQGQENAERLAQYIVAEQISEEKVQHVKYAAQRVTDHLQEILRTTSMSADLLQTTSQEQEQQLAQTLQNTFDADEAAYWMLRLETEFDSFETVLDEYLYCLQVGLNLSLFETDRDSYEKQVEESQMKLRREEALTAQKLEEMMLETLRSSNVQQSSQPETGLQEGSGIPSAQNPAPNVVPQKQDPRPQNPGVQAMEEVEAITQGWMR